MRDPFDGRVWRTRQALVVLLAFAVLLVASLVRDPSLVHSWRQPAALALTAAFFGAVYLALRLGTLPLFALLAGITVALIAVAPHTAGGTFIAVMGGIAARLELRAGLRLAALFGLSSIGLQYALLGPGVLEQAPLELLAAGLTYLGVYSIRRRRDEEARTRALEREAARSEERERVAREIHDVLAHSLTATAVQLDLAQTLLRTAAGDPAALQAVERARALAREGLQDARRAVAALRGDELPGPELLERLASDFERDSGVRCRAEVPEELPALRSEERVALYRTAQEALTNVRKHARAQTVVLRLRHAEGGVELTVVNDGAQREGGRGGGFGLTGMRERAELLGGRLEAGPTPEPGFRVRLWLPAT